MSACSSSCQPSQQFAPSSQDFYLPVSTFAVKKERFVKQLQFRTNSVHSQRWQAGCISAGRDLSCLWTRVTQLICRDSLTFISNFALHDFPHLLPNHGWGELRDQTDWWSFQLGDFSRPLALLSFSAQRGGEHQSKELKGEGHRVSAQHPLPAAVNEMISPNGHHLLAKRRLQLWLSCGCFISQAVTDTGMWKNVSHFQSRQGYSPSRKLNALAGSTMKISLGSCSPRPSRGLVPVLQPHPAHAGRLGLLWCIILMRNMEKILPGNAWTCNSWRNEHQPHTLFILIDVFHY